MGQLAGRQFGRVARWQLLRDGIGATTVDNWVRQGYLHPRLPGVYAVGHAAPSTEGELAETLLYAGAGAMLSNATAIWWYGLLDERPWRTEISIPGRRKSRHRLKIQNRRTIDRVWHKGMPITTVAQALLDFAATAPLRRVEYVVSQAEYHELLVPTALQEITGRGKSGSRRLRQAAKLYMPQLARTRSYLERLFLPLVRSAGIPIPDVDLKIEGILVDAVWREQRVVVELDGGKGHTSRARMVRDRRNELKLRAAGYIVLRYTWDQLEQEPEAVIADLLSALVSRGLAL